METLQVRPSFVDLTDCVERCEHGWPIELAECPHCAPAVLKLIGDSLEEKENEWGEPISKLDP